MPRSSRRFGPVESPVCFGLTAAPARPATDVQPLTLVAALYVHALDSCLCLAMWAFLTCLPSILASGTLTCSMVFMQRQCLGRISPQRQYGCIAVPGCRLQQLCLPLICMCVCVRLALNLDPWFSSLCPASIPTYCLDLACSLTVYCMLCPPSPLLLCLASSNLPWVFSAAA